MAAPELLFEPLRTPDVMAAKLLIQGGSARDARHQRGAHQLLASLLTRGCGPFDHRQLADLVEGRGAGLRCEAHEDALLISLRCLHNDAMDLLPILGWMISAPHLNQEQLELERDLALQALQRQREDPFQIAFDGWRELVYGEGAYGHDPLGVEQDVVGLRRRDLSPLANGLSQERSVLAIAGVWPKAIETELLLQKAFSDWSPATPRLIDAVATDPSGTETPGAGVLVREQDTEQVVMMLGQATVPHGHSDDLALRLLQAHLGLGMSSLLFRCLREEHGVAYDVGLHHPCRAGAAPFVMHASSGADRAELTLQLLLDIWNELLSKPISDQDLALAKSKFIGQMAHSHQTSSQRAERRVQLRGLGLPDNHDQRMRQQLEQVSADDLLKVAAQRLGHPQLSLCGPADRLKTMQHWWNGVQG